MQMHEMFSDTEHIHTHTHTHTRARARASTSHVIAYEIMRLVLKTGKWNKRVISF